MPTFASAHALAPSHETTLLARRLRHYDDNGLARYVAAAKYTRYRRDLGRHESYEDAVERVAGMHREFFRDRLVQRVVGDVTRTAADPADHERLAREIVGARIDELITQAFAAVAARRVLPSMRSLQFGGEAILRHHARLFNCAFSPADRIGFFREFFFLLLAGTGCGFSVQRHHVERLPALPRRPPGTALPRRRHVVADTIEGWADALDFLLHSRLHGFSADFDTSQLRPCGSPLTSSGGTAPGPEPLERALAEVETILDCAAGRKLRPIEVYDICMFVARAVLSGGVRRSASICLFSPDDEEMMNAKTGAWLQEHPQRAACNNSAVLSPTGASEELFRRLFLAQKEFGEPGFYFAEHPDHGCNPCGEAGLDPVLAVPVDQAEISRLRELGYFGALTPGMRLSGWQMCNLSTINGAVLRTPEEVYAACIHATVIGTLQAAYTDIGYLGPVTRYLNERDALLGVSICGFMDNPAILFDPVVLARGARLCRAVNDLVAAALGVRPAARITCVKPEGTASLLLGAAAGVHPHHARYYFRRVRAGRRDPVYRHFQARNPHMTERSIHRPESDDVITFPVESPAHAITRDEVGAREFLQRVLHVQRHWVLPGEAPAARSPGLHHNVSHTCTVRPGEWEDVARFIWQHRASFTGVALLAYDGGKSYPQAPLEAVANEDDVRRWNALVYFPVDYTTLTGTDEEPALADTDVCAAGACDAP